MPTNPLAVPGIEPDPKLQRTVGRAYSSTPTKDKLQCGCIGRELLLRIVMFETETSHRPGRANKQTIYLEKMTLKD
jgi:hypothetical protein